MTDQTSTTHYEIRARIPDRPRPTGGTTPQHWGRFGHPTRNRADAEKILTVAAEAMPRTRVRLVEVVETETTVKELNHE